MRRFAVLLVVAGTLVGAGSANAAVGNYGNCVSDDFFEPSEGEIGPSTVTGSGASGAGR